MTERSVRRRTLLSGVAGVTTLAAGCISTSPTPPGSDVGGSGGETTSPPTSGGDGPGLLKAGGSSTVYPITSKAASFWGSNFAPSDEEYWGPDQYGIDTDQRLADYWAELYGFEPTGTSGVPPFEVKVNLSHSGTGLKNLRAGRLDIGDASAPVEAELSDLSQDELDTFVDHVVGVDAQPIVVSKSVYDAGVTEMSGDTLKAIYEGTIEDWSDVPGYDGPSKTIQCVGRAVGSGTDTAFRKNLFGDPNAKMPGIDVRKGENQQVASLVENSTNAIAYMALAFVTESTPAIALEFDGTVYEPGKNLAQEGYPLARDLHCYTYEDTAPKEAAFLRMILSDYGQEKFVKSAGYATLTDDRQQKELAKLPDTR